MSQTATSVPAAAVVAKATTESVAGSSAHPGRSAGLVLALLGAVGFSFKAILIKLAYRYGVDAETLLALRMGFALPFFLVMGVMAERRAARRMAGRDWLWMLLLGAFGYYLASYLDFLGLRYISAALERLILFTYPTIVVLLSAAFLGKPLTRRVGAALVLCYAGVGLAVNHDVRLSGATGEVLLGGALVLASAFSYALYLMGNGQIVGRLGAARVTAWASAVACLLALAQFFALRPAGALAQPGPVLALSAAMALVSTVLPVWMVSEAIRRLGAGPVSLIGTLGPIVTIFLGWLLLDEPVGAIQLVGAAFVTAGVLVMARR